MISRELSEAVVEFNCILANSSKEIIKKIPTKFLNFLKSIESNTYKFEYDRSKSLNKQELKPETRGLIALVYQDYICNDEERKEYIEKCKVIMEENENIKRKKYNPNDIFKKADNKQEISNIEKPLNNITEYKENIFQKILKLIKKIIKK